MGAFNLSLSIQKRKPASDAARVIFAVKKRLSNSVETVAAVFANRELRRLELGRVAATVSASGTAVLYVLLAYRADGAGAVAALIVVTTWTAAVASPLGSIVADRFPRSRVIVGADATRVLLLLATAAFADRGSVLLVIVLAASVTVVGTASSSARAALVPVLATDSAQLVGANAVAAMTSSGSSLVGPAVAGAAVAAAGPELALGVLALASVGSAVAALGIHERGERRGSRSRSIFGAEALAGFRALLASRPVRVVVALTSAQTFVGGVLAVLLVVAAIETLGLGETGPSFLAIALSAGTLLGSITLLLLGEQRLGATMALGLGIWGVSAALVGLAPAAALGLALIGLIGLGDALADLTALSIVQRIVPNDVLARALGGLRGVFYTLASLGSLVAPVVVDLVGVRPALVVSGLVVPAMSLALWPALSRAGAAPPAASLQALSSVELFSALLPAALERLAAAAEPRTVDAGTEIVRQGDADRGFYLIADGRVEVEVSGSVVSTLGAGDYFGEIASLRDSARTATVRATMPTELYVIEADEFLAALSEDEDGYGAAERTVADRLARAV